MREERRGKQGTGDERQKWGERKENRGIKREKHVMRGEKKG